ncbi:hypothetical protein Acr_00g0046260 [Actinidia rufa]|uniref:Uncharacterized protein n=1 Tax=Actinidia rufa TaxID=165716 RepID=A0A7J0DJH5_9ERIC|nr:hypothetical protein Acr_00g0046260 [Actinidia rufa]
MQILDKPFSAEDLLHVYTVVQPKKEPCNPFYEGNHYLCLRKPDQPQTRLVTSNPNKDLFLDEFVWVSGAWEFRVGDDDLWSFSRYNRCLPNKPTFLHCVSRAELRDAMPLAPKTQSRAQHTLPLSARGKGQEVSVVEPKDPTLPIFISSSDNECSNDLAHTRPPSVGEVKDVGLNSIGADTMRFRNLRRKPRQPSSPKVPLSDKCKGASSGVDSDLWRLEFSACELGRQVTVTDFAQDYDISLQRAMAISDPIAEQSVELKRAKKNISNLESELKKVKLALGWLAYSEELGIPEDNLTLTKAAPVPEFLESLPPYLPMILPGFDEEKYLNRPDKDENVPEPVLAHDMASTNEASNPAEEAGKTIAEVSKERSVEKTGKDNGEDLSQDPPPEL